MAGGITQELLRGLPSVSTLLDSQTASQWLESHPRSLVVDCIRTAVDGLRQDILDDQGGACGAAHVTQEAVLERAGAELDNRTQPHLRGAINATGIILHTGLGRAVWPAEVVDSMADELKGYVTLAIDRQTGKRSERDQRLEYLITELTGAEAGIVVNNNAAATMLVLAALAAERECIVSRGQLIEIGGSFRLPDVMELSRARLVEVGTTNRTHLRDYSNAITEETGAILRVHPSNYRIMGFASQPELSELVELAHERGLVMIDDLGAGALVDLEQFGLPHEPTIQESISAGADIVLASTDKLIGASQGGLIVGRKKFIDIIRRHPLYRAMRVDKTCLMALERTLMLFRDMEQLKASHPTYMMLSSSQEQLQARAEILAASILTTASNCRAVVVKTVGYLGSGSLPMEQLPTFAVELSVPGIKASELAQRLREDTACIFGRIEGEMIVLDCRTITDKQVEMIAQAAGRIAKAQL